jgi:hypothetical protein
MAYENAREFLSRAVAWPQGQEGFVNVHWTTVRAGAPKPYWNGRASRTVDEAIRNLAWAIKSPENRDFYVCMSMQSEAEEKISKAGNKYLNAKRSGDNAVKFKSLFIDVDVKAGAYPDTQAAVTALGNFRKAVGLPRPTFVVASGSGGFHVHWVLKDAIDKADWSVLAHQLVEATRTHGLMCDSQCTIDAARILRIPDTHNYKYDPPGNVEFLLKPSDDCDVEDIRAALSPFSAPAPAFPARPMVGGADDLSAGIDLGKAAPVKLEDLKPECAFVREALDTGGASYTNPLWNLTTFIATFAEDGRAMAHEMAKGHSGYDPETTDALFDRKEAEKQKKDLGWPSCNTIAASGYMNCNACPHRFDGKSPLHFTPKAHQTTKADDDLPPGYSRDANDMVYLSVPLDDGSVTKQVISNYPFSNGWMQRNPWVLNFSTMVEKGKREQVGIPFEHLHAKAEFAKHIAQFGMTLKESNQKLVKDFLMGWVDKLREKENSIVTSTPFGWVIPRNGGKVDGFSYAGTVFSKGEPRPAANPNPVLARHYEPSGMMDPWLYAAKLITDQKRPALDVILACAFAGPLTMFTGENGFMVSAYSPESGIGKTSAVSVAQAVWGDPQKAVQALDDTQLSVLNKMGQLKNLPMFWDELKNEDDTRKFVNTVFKLTSGREKSRLNQQAQMKDSGDWQTLMFIASNDSLIEYVTRGTRTTVAGVVRVFEYVVSPPTGSITKDQHFTTSISKLKHNFGWAGRKYAEFLGQNYDRIDADLKELDMRLTKKFEWTQEERYWAGAISCCLLGAEYSNELELTEIDIPAMEDFFEKAVTKLRNDKADQPVDMTKKLNVSSVLTQFLNRHRAENTLYTNKVHLSKGKPPRGSIQVKRDASRLKALFVQVGIEDNVIRIGADKLTEWLEERHISTTVFTQAMAREFSATKFPGRLGAGTDYALGTEYVWQFQAKGTPLAEFAAVDEEEFFEENDGQG